MHKKFAGEVVSIISSPVHPVSLCCFCGSVNMLTGFAGNEDYYTCPTCGESTVMPLRDHGVVVSGNGVFPIVELDKAGYRVGGVSSTGVAYIRSMVEPGPYKVSVFRQGGPVDAEFLRSIGLTVEVDKNADFS